MRKYLLISVLIILTFYAEAQSFSDKYNKDTEEADSLFSEKKYLESAKKYSIAFSKNNSIATKWDRYNAAKSWALAEKKDSAFYNLELLASSGCYYTLKNTGKDKTFKSLHQDKRWQVLLSSIDRNRYAMSIAIPPTYKKYQIQGFEVLVSITSLQEHRDSTDSAINLLTRDLEKITLLPLKKEVLDFFRTIRIYIDWKSGKGGVQFNPSEDWLIQNGFIPEKAGCITISSIRHYLSWQKAAQPYMILHELAHAYHANVLGNDYKPILAAYNNALNKKLYLNVSSHSHDGIYVNAPKAYALLNEREYFAELTEAYLGLNDFFPFIRSDLKKYDKKGYKILKLIWGTL